MHKITPISALLAAWCHHRSVQCTAVQCRWKTFGFSRKTVQGTVHVGEHFVLQKDNLPDHTNRIVHDYPIKKDVKMLVWPEKNTLDTAGIISKT